VQKTFHYETIQFTYHLIQEPRKTLAATVYPDQSVVVKAPMEATTSDVDGFLKRKWRWILKQQRYFGQFRPRPEREYVTGETFRYLGRSYKLTIETHSDAPHVVLRYGKLTVLTPRPGNRKEIQDVIDDWYLEKARKVFARQLTECFALFTEKEMPTLGIRKLSKRWGSYLRRDHRIILNRSLIQASKRHINYVILHELCHIEHARHNKAFYSLLREKLPQWKEVKADLEQKLLAD